MKTVRVRVHNGKVIGDAPPGLEEGQELDLYLEPVDDMTEEERAELHRVLDESIAAADAGDVVPAAEVIADLRTR